MNNPLIKETNNTPKDFFLWLGIIITLYVSTVSLIVLLFEYIKILFPDPLDYFVDPYRGTIRFSIAALIVLFPVFLFLTRKVNTDIRKFPEKQNLWIRKWGLYLTIFIGSIAVIVNAIVAINVFLGGETTTQFVLKILVLFIVIGEIMGYYWFDLKGYWRKKEKLSQTYGAVVGGLVLGAVIAGFFIMGSPAEQRLFRFDQERVTDLDNIQWQILSRYQQGGEVVESLDLIMDDFSGFAVPVDPETGAPYEYKKTGNLSFTLCAVFNRDSIDTRNETTFRPKYGFENANWTHTEGENCFERTIDPQLYPVFEIRN